MQAPVVLSGTSRALKWQEKDKHLVFWEDDEEAMPEMAVGVLGLPVLVCTIPIHPHA